MLVPSLPRDLVTPRNIRKDWFTPECRWLQFFDENSEQKSLLEHVIDEKKVIVQPCETICCNGSVVKTIYAAVSQKESRQT